MFVSITEDFEINMEDLAEKITSNTRVVSITGGSNVTGTLPDWTAISSMVRSKQSSDNPIYLIMDGSQLVAHEPLRVKELDLDFAFFTGHKVFADMGIGVLFGKKSHLKMMKPSIGGGGAINYVTETDFEFAGLPFRYEPGTPNVSGAVSLLSAFQYIESIGGYTAIREYEKKIIQRMLDGFEQRKNYLNFYGSKNPEKRTGVFSFSFPGKHSGDMAEKFALK